MSAETERSGQSGLIYGLHRGDGVIRYVGLTTTTIEQRLSEHRGFAYRGGQRPLYYWMRKHGPHEIEAVVLEVVDEETDLNQREIHWIKELGTFIGLKTERNGSNCTTGGRQTQTYPRLWSEDDVDVEADAPEALLEWILECAEMRENNPDQYDRRLEDLREWYAEPLRGGRSIDEFVEIYQRRKNYSRCTVCSLPVELIEQIESARDRENPISFPLIAEWLESEHGTTINPVTIPNHFRGLHHKR